MPIGRSYNEFRTLVVVPIAWFDIVQLQEIVVSVWYDQYNERAVHVTDPHPHPTLTQQHPHRHPIPFPAPVCDFCGNSSGH